MGIGEAEAFSERLKRELLALEAANVHAILESEPLIDEVFPLILYIGDELILLCFWLSFFNLYFVVLCKSLCFWLTSIALKLLHLFVNCDALCHC